MTNKEILDLYEIEMYTCKYNFELRPIFSGGGDLSSFFMGYETSEDIYELIEQITHFINGNIPPWADGDNLGGFGNLAYIDQSSGVVHFNDSITGEITQIFPLEHFKIIAEIWRDFLSSNDW